VSIAGCLALRQCLTQFVPPSPPTMGLFQQSVSPPLEACRQVIQLALPTL
jgi:hypothetical protein